MLRKNQPKPPTEEQEAALRSDARITVVRACPGAGKTEVFVEAIRTRLRHWDHLNGGLAALSFTNVARDTIEERIGGATPYPHFIGTLDAFSYRFIVKPFGHLVGLPQNAIRLFPATIAKVLEDPVIKVGDKNHERASIYSISFFGGDREKPRMKTKLSRSNDFVVPPASEIRVLNEKKRFWKSTGIVTHSDCHYLSCCIVNHPTFGKNVRKILTSRFPVILIDELQDTGFFLARAFLAILAEEKSFGFVVGDPNQAIYGFSGANPSIFKDFESLANAKSLSLSLSHRCSKAVAKVANALSSTGSELIPIPSAIDGSACLSVHDLEEAVLSPAHVEFLKSLKIGSSLAILSRRTKTACGLKGEIVKDEFRGVSKAARRVHRALQLLINGEPREAHKLLQTELARIILGDETAKAIAWEERGISQLNLRNAVFSVLRNSFVYIPNESWNEWVKRTRDKVMEAAKSLGWTDDGKAFLTYRSCNEKGNTPRSNFMKTSSSMDWDVVSTISTIHKVKGAEFDTVILFVPKTTKGNCPSIEWWPGATDADERRIAYVAVSRAKIRFVLCVHKSVFKAIEQLRPDFIKCFEESIPMPQVSKPETPSLF